MGGERGIYKMLYWARDDEHQMYIFGTSFNPNPLSGRGFGWHINDTFDPLKFH